MRLTIIIFIATIFLFSCSTKQDKSEIYYVVKHEKIKPDTDSIPPPPALPLPFYGNYNFILLDTSKIFYHTKNKHYSCGYGLDFTKPFDLFLTPENLTEMEINNLDLFLKSIPDSIISDRYFFTSLSSPKDTIKNRAFKIITTFLKSKNIKYYNVRNWTEEEQYVTTAKLENKKYDRNAVEWKVGFGDRINFIPPTDTLPEALFDKNKPFEILNFQRGITKQSSASDTNMCKGWRIKPTDLQKIIINSKVIDGQEWHDLFDVLPCIMTGQLKQNHQQYKIEINGGSWMYIFCRDTTLLLGSFTKQNEKYFISKAWDGK